VSSVVVAVETDDEKQMPNAIFGTSNHHFVALVGFVKDNRLCFEKTEEMADVFGVPKKAALF
jgi:hypothetical protein